MNISRIGITGVNKEKERRREDEMEQKIEQESVKEALRCCSESGSQDTEQEMRFREVTGLCVRQMHRSVELLLEKLCFNMLWVHLLFFVIITNRQQHVLR